MVVSDAPDDIGFSIHEFIKKMYPVCRSITGNGVRKTLAMLQELIPLEVFEVATGTKVFDWEVPREWNINDAYIKATNGKKLVDFKDSNLHVVNYSIPVNRMITLKELQAHLHSLPEYPELIPYRTTYYNETWGFCIKHSQAAELKDDLYEVVIDSSLTSGHLTYGEFFIQGKTDREVLISCHVSHPSLCNDNLSGIAVCAYLAKQLKELNLNYSYRFLFIPATIGSITWLAKNREKTGNIKHGLVAVNLGDQGNTTYKKSRQGDAEIDRAVKVALRDSGHPYKVIDFSPDGYDERQYCSPGFNLPVGSIMRTPHSQFPEYHTSADNPDFVKPEFLYDSYKKILYTIGILEDNKTYLSANPFCEPQLGKRGLCKRTCSDKETDQLSVLWVLNKSDGGHSLLDIAGESGISFSSVKAAADLLVRYNLLSAPVS